MRFNFKKVASVLASAAMLGSTIGMAAAAAYPAPFVEGGAGDVAVVYGDLAVDDFAAATNIGNNLGTFITAGGAPTSGEFYKIEKDTDKLNIGNNLTSIQTIPLSDDHLPTVLKDGTYANAESEDFDYEQKVEFHFAVQYTHWADSNYKDKSPSIGLKLDKNDPVLNYTIDFSKSPEDDTKTEDWTDLEDTTIALLGKSFTIVDAHNTSTPVKLTLMGGTTKDTLALNEEGTYVVDGNSYTVKLTYVDSDECQFEVNGDDTQKLNKGEQGKASGVTIGVTEIDYSTGAVTEIMECDFFVGADKIELETNKTIQVNDENENGMKAWIDYTISSGVNYLDKITIEWKAGEDLFVTDESSVNFPIFGGFKLTSDGLTTAAQEETEIKGASDYVAQIKTTLKSGPATIEFLSSGTNKSSFFDKIGGDGADEGLATTNGTGTGTVLHYRLNDSGDQYAVVTYLSGASGSSYLVSVDCDTDDGCDFKDEVTGSTLASDKKNQTSFTIGDATVRVDYFEEDLYVNISGRNTETYFDRIVTNEGLVIYLPVSPETRRFGDGAGDIAIPPWVGKAPYINLTGGGTPGAHTVGTELQGSTFVLWMEEEDKDGNLPISSGGGSVTEVAGGSDLNVSVGHTSSDKVQVSAVAFDWSEDDASPSYIDDPDDDNMNIGYARSDLGSKVYYDTDPDEDTALIIYAGTQSYGGVYVAETAAGATTDNAIVPVKDSAIDSVSGKNLIVVGGTCVNKVAQKLLGSDVALCGADWTTKTGRGADEWLIQTFVSPYSTSKIAVLVAGWEAEDTKKAATYLTSNKPDVEDTTTKINGPM